MEALIQVFNFLADPYNLALILLVQVLAYLALLLGTMAHLHLQ